MIIYHTSDKIIERPAIAYSRLYLDFGKGFYTTPNKVQAVKYAKRFFRDGRTGFLNTFEVDEKQLVNYSKKILTGHGDRYEVPLVSQTYNS